MVTGGAYAALLLFWRGARLAQSCGARVRVRCSASGIACGAIPARSKRSTYTGPGGADARAEAPFHFIEEHSRGSQPCVSVRDANGRRWRVKWGHEVPCETFAVRLAWACGYFAESDALRRVGHDRRRSAR